MAKAIVSPAIQKHWREFARDPKAVLKRTPRCKACIRAGHRAYYHRNKHRMKDALWERHLRNKYGLTLDEYRGLVEAQNGRCGICGLRKKLCIDHEHNNGGRIRGMLCRDCNQSLGKFGDTADGVRRALHYLEPSPAARVLTCQRIGS